MPFLPVAGGTLMPIRRSRTLALLLGFMGICAAVLALGYLPLAVTLALGLPGAMGLIHAIKMHALRTHGQSVVAVRCSLAGLACESRSGAWQEVVIQPGGFVSAWLTVVRLDSAQPVLRGRNLVLVPGCMGFDDYRRFRLFLRWMGRKREASTS